MIRCPDHLTPATADDHDIGRETVADCPICGGSRVANPPYVAGTTSVVDRLRITMDMSGRARAGEAGREGRSSACVRNAKEGKRACGELPLNG